MDHINNGPYQLLNKDPTSKVKAKAMKQLNALNPLTTNDPVLCKSTDWFLYDGNVGCQRVKNNECIDNRLYSYVKPIHSPGPRFYGQPKIQKLVVPIRPIALYSGSTLYNLNNVKHKNNKARNSTTYSNYIRNFPIEDG